MRVAITGAHGYLGGHLKDAFIARGDSVLSLVRTPKEENEITYLLGDEIREGLLSGADALIHCAHDFSGNSLESSLKINLEGSRRLFAAAKEAGVTRIVFISSMAAFPGCRSIYGKTKLEVEKAASEYGAWALRPGTIYGGKGEGLFGALKKLATKLPVVPLIGSGEQKLFLVHIDDLAEVIVRIVHDDEAAPKEAVSVAAKTPWRLKDILKKLAGGRRVLFIPVPSALITTPLLIGEKLGVRLPFRSDSVVSINNTDPSPRVLSTIFEVELRPFS
ncbi:MAG: NAD-dependent epimerase/dehydratase family protein [Deltaproteobacteria bacterium]|nr:NAD-dependent epimerase/dehydratase family protein [Deltaproteobacteria bacterium]